MCLIIYSPTGRIPRKHMQRGLSHNKDGWGYMFVRDGQLQVRKGMDRKAFWQSWRTDNVQVPVVWHARWGTQGKRDETNCHPFIVPGHGIGFCHNGIIRQYVNKQSDLCDSALFAGALLSQLPQGFCHNPAIKILLEDFLGCSKAVLMEPNGNVLILNSELGYWHKSGRWYSNAGWRPDRVRVNRRTLFALPEDEEPDDDGMAGMDDLDELEEPLEDCSPCSTNGIFEKYEKQNKSI